MTGFDRIKEQIKDQRDIALNQVVEYLLTRDDMQANYLKEEKTLEDMCNFIKQKAKTNAKKGWNFVTNEVVYSWAIMYYSLPNEFLKISTNKKKETEQVSNNDNNNNVVLLEQAKKEMEKKKEIKQLSLFGGV